MFWYISFLARLLVGLALLCGGIAKSLNFSWFTEILHKYDLIPAIFVRKVAFAVAALELGVGVGLIASLMLPWVAYAAVIVLVIFTLAVGIALKRGKFNMACGCGSPASKATVGWQAIFRNLGLIALSCVAAIPRNEPIRLAFVLPFASAVVLLGISVWRRGTPHQTRTPMETSAQPTVSH